MTGTAGPIHVLHVDDDPELAELTASFLERKDDRLVVETVTSASEGLERLAGDGVDCIVSDHDMPGMNGIEFLETVREDYPELPFILFTGKGSEEVASEAISCGVTDYLQKQSGTERYDLLANRVVNAVQQYRATHRVADLDRIHRVYEQVSRTATEAETRAEIERRVCDIVSSAEPYLFAWVGERDRDSQTIEPRTSAGIEESYLDSIEIGTEAGATGRGPTAKAVRDRELAVVQDISDDGTYERWREAALRRGYRSSAAVPLVHDGTSYGVLSVYADRTDAFDEREREILAEIGDTVAHAIHRTRLQNRLRRYRRLVDRLPVGVYRATDGPDGEIVDANPALADVFDADSVESVLGRSADVLHGTLDDRAASDGREDLVQDGKLRRETLGGEQKRVAVTTMRSETDGETYLDGIVRDVTERERLERDVHRFRRAVEHAGHVVLVTDANERIRYVNEAFESVTGYTAEEAIGETPAMLQSGEHDPDFYRDLWETILDGDVWQGEVVNERKDGEQYVVDQTIAPITDDETTDDDITEDDIIGFVAINRDISDRRERERNLTFLKRAIDQAGIGIGTYDRDGRATYVNYRLADLLGTDPDDLQNRCLEELDVEDGDRRMSEYGGSDDERERRIRDTQIERIDTGETVPVEVVESQVAIGDESYLVSTVHDITDRKRRERELRRFRSAVEHAGHGVLITDVDGTIEYVNDAFTETNGYSAEEAVGETPAMLQSGEHDPDFYRDLWETILDGDVWQGEVVNEGKDGEQYVVDQTIAPITDDGEITGFVAINRDITELRRYQRELKEQNERLQQYGQTVAHDLRNPLNLLRGKLDQLRTATAEAERGVDRETVQRRCGDIEEVVGRMEALIDDLLVMAEQGRLVIDDERVSLETAAEEAWNQLETGPADLTVDGGSVNADPHRLRELLSNLFRNAIEHAGSDVRVRVGPLGSEEGFFVEDDGPGIPPEKRDHVLERGYTTAAEGTGFGLAIVEQISRAHNWTVTVTDGRDGGARFEFRDDGDS